MSSSEIDSTLLDLFREEVRGQVNVLNQGLVELERSSDPSQVEPLMRAAHSIKGAARLIGVDPAVKLAHVMEDCLVAVQHGALQLTPAGIDYLLAGSDWLARFGEYAGNGFSEWFSPYQSTISQLIQDLERVLLGESLATPLKIESASASSAASELPKLAETVQGAEAVTMSVEPWNTSVATDIDPDSLTLFQSDILNSLETLRTRTKAWHERPLTAEEYADSQLAARNIRCVAVLFRIEPLTQVSSLLENAWRSVALEHSKLNDVVFDVLMRATDLQQRLAEAVGQNYEQHVAENSSQIDVVLRELSEQGRSADLKPTYAPPMVTQQATINLSTRNTDASDFNALSSITTTSVASPSVEPDRLAKKPVPPKPALAPGAMEPEDTEVRVVRVTAKNLTRLMGLAGESLVEARWLQPFAQSLLNLKRDQDRLTDVIDELAESLSPADAAASHSFIKELRQKLSQNRNMLGNRIEEFESHARRSDDLNSRLYNEVIASRMRPMSDGVQGYPRMIRDISRQLGKSVNFEIVGETTPVDRDILEKLDGPLNHILRNALDHGIETTAERIAAGKPETANLRMETRHNAGMFAITISDDGRGIDLERLRAKIVDRKLSTTEMVSRMTDAELYQFLFLPGFSTRGEVTELSGRGVGLDVVHTMATSVGGTVRVQSQLGRGTSFHLNLPITLSVIRAVLVDVAGEPYAFPLNRIDRLLRVSPNTIGSVEHRQFLRVDGQNVGVVLGTQILRMTKNLRTPPPSAETSTNPATSPAADELFLVLFSNHADQYGLLVDGFLGEQDLVVRPLDHRLGKVPNVSAAAVLDDGAPALIIDVDDVRRAIEIILETGKLERTDEGKRRQGDGRKKRILVVDDSITVREVERQLLSSRGYDVTVAVDGADGWNIVRDGDFDLVISDVDMPNMNGIEFTKKIKADSRLQRLPVVIVSYKDSEEDRMRGLDAGANYYLTKSSFHDESLIDAVYTLIGESQ